VKKALQFLILLLVLLNVNGLRAANSTSVPDPDFLSSISVTVITPGGSGSGVAFTRTNELGEEITFVWTAGHVCQHRESGPVFSFNDSLPVRRQERIVYYTNVFVMQDVTINGEYAYTTNLSATVIKCSPNETGNDLAILRVNGKFFNQNTTRFDLSGRIPKLGESLYGLSSPYGEYGMFTKGMYSFIGRNIDGTLYDQTTLIIYPGSSGSAVFGEDGKCVGLVLMMRAPQLGYIVPVRRMQKWAKDEHVEWALDPKLPMPTAKELKELKREDQVPFVKKVKVVKNPFKPEVKEQAKDPAKEPEKAPSKK
jgi:hypothetical protein